MPFDKQKDLPKSVKKVLPEHGEHIYKEAFNNAWRQYDKPEERRGGASQEEVAHKVAWSAVKTKYKKNENTGKWIRKN